MDRCPECECEGVHGLGCSAWEVHMPTDSERLACSRCGDEVTMSYQVGRCYEDQCEPAEMDEHDEAEPWDSVHGASVPLPPPPGRET